MSTEQGRVVLVNTEQGRVILKSTVQGGQTN